MTWGTLIARSLRFYWRTHLLVLAGVAVSGAIIAGALVVGDSVRSTLRHLALLRLGNVTHALLTGDRFFREALADDTGTVPIVLTRGTVGLPDGSARANDVQICGVDDRFWKLGATTNFTGIVLNERLATQLAARVGDTVVVRLEPPSWLPRDAPLSGPAEATTAFRGPVAAIAGDREFGRFSLQANQVPPHTIFVPLTVLQAELQRPGRVNALLAAGSMPDLRRHWTLADAGLELRPLSTGTELRSERVFLDPAVAEVALRVAPDGAGSLTYFVNEIRLGDKTTPYSFVTALLADLLPDEIIINSWLANDLGAKPGDQLTLRYYVLGEQRQLTEQSAQFRVGEIQPTTRDDSWMPSFPGLSDADSCRDWEPGIPIALDRIRPQDEAYWQEFRGTPKAFVALATGQKLWGNRFGNLTAIRFQPDVAVAERLRLEPPLFVPVREQALRASTEGQDFGQLFFGFSFFLIVAALALTGMLFVFNLGQRRAELGLLRALGFEPKLVRRLVVAEGGALALLGTIIGSVLGVAYAKLTLLGLATVWRGAVGSTVFELQLAPVTLAKGAALGLGAAWGVMWLAQRRQRRYAPATLMCAGGDGLSLQGRGGRTTRTGLWIALASTLGAAALLSLANAGAFFGAGACLLVGGIGVSDYVLRRLANSRQFGLRNAARRRGRSLTTVGVLASGVFLLVAVNAFRHDTEHGGPGTGGFAWYAQTTLPVHTEPPGAVGMRVWDGDDASCLNLNRAQQPRLLGVNPGRLAQRAAFGRNWERLDQEQPDEAVPAIGDEATVRWALGKKIGDTLSCADEQGRPFQLRIVEMIPNSILQGSLVISEANFIRRFPTTAGYRVFLLDALPADGGQSLADRGFEAVPAGRRLGEFMEVENTYLAIFQALGGLGLVLGSVGLAIVVLRNVLECRGELALLQAVGFNRRALRWLVVSEHWLLVALGIGVGLMAALVAVWPTAGLRIPFGTLTTLALGGMAWSWSAAWLALRQPLLPALRNE